MIIRPECVERPANHFFLYVNFLKFCRDCHFEVNFTIEREAFEVVLILRKNKFNLFSS